MDSTSMPRDWELTEMTPVEIAPVEIAVAWVHLPSGAAAVQGVVRHPDGGPIVAGSALRSRPVGAGGIDVLYEGVDPTGGPRHGRAPLLRSQWALTDTDGVAETLAMRGWRLMSRAEAARMLTEQGYQLRHSNASGHVLHLDLADDTIWHDWVAVSGKPFSYIQVAFVARPLASTHAAASATAMAVAEVTADLRSESGSDRDSRVASSVNGACA